MALTAAEKIEFESLQRELGSPRKTAGGLSKSESIELAKLEKELSQDIPVAPSLSDNEEQPQERGILEKLGRGAIESLPAVGGVLGGAAGLASPVPGGTLIGAGAGAVAGEGLKQQAQSLFFPEEAPKTTKEAFTRQLGSGTTFAAGEGAGALAAKALASGAKTLFPLAKKGASEIVASARRLGITPTKGMVTKSKIVQGLESSLEQSPTITGATSRRIRDKIEDAMSRRLAKITNNQGGGLTKFEVGETVKESIKGNAGAKIAEARSIYKSLEDKMSNTQVSPNLLSRVREKLSGLSVVRLQPKSSAGKLASEISESVNNIKTVQDLKEFRTILGSRYDKNMDKATRKVLDESYDAITEIRKNSLIFDQQSASQIKAADKIWKEFFDEFKSLDASFGGRPSKSPEQFIAKLDALEGSDVSQKLFQAQKVGRLGKLKESLPSEFTALSEQRVGELVDKSLVKGQVDSRKLIRNVSKLPPETKKLMFGDDGVQALKDVETIINAFPDKIGPSGTPQGIDFLTPTGFLKEIRDILRVVRKKAIPSGISEAKQLKIANSIESLSRLAGFTAADIKSRNSTKPIERRLRAQ